MKNIGYGIHGAHFHMKNVTIAIYFQYVWEEVALYMILLRMNIYKNIRCIPLRFYINEAIELGCRILQKQRRDKNAI